ncbi:uncharacterized protein F4812DRAFT_450259 [Daldinia caldariorum]|uniref:uncharacterized protein n=1 Tax=Daldinia caldariorum TaxID=326644 RepID=UPI002007C17D|nr:uncharacterized protein F4812DRAFT_450259 [Daldinia caldariorum]KAI1469841.1 hypothetical protein F4812DRAFT_450259 [Daldinia caldariorum]
MLRRQVLIFGKTLDSILPFLWTLLAASIHDIGQLDWIPGFAYQFGMLVVITFLCSPLISHARKDPLKVEGEVDGTLNYNLTTAYKIYNNPRMLPIKLEKPSRAVRVSNAVLVKFTSYRLLKILVFVALNISLNRAMTPIFSTCTLDDFSPAREAILRRLISGTVSRHDLGIRAFISTIWILHSVFQLEISHVSMSILLVTVLRRFWGRYWHRLFASAGIWARAIKVLAAFLLFTMSGIAHAIVGWRIGDSAPERDVLFFWYNFLAVCFEIIVSKYWPSEKLAYLLHWVGLHGRAQHVARRLFGFLWVWTFFMWSTPRLVYPKIYALLLASITK